MQVLITVDTEFSASPDSIKGDAFRRNIRSAIYGGDQGRFGIPYQLEVLNRCALKGVFFVEALAADVVGLDALGEVVGLIRQAGQEVQLHIHTEWLKHCEPHHLDWLKAETLYQNIGEFSYDQQVAILGRGLANLRAVGVDTVTAFRAGNFGADGNTLRAAATLGLTYDTSYNACFADSRGPCKISPGRPMIDCQPMNGVVEVPVTFFDDKISGLRPLQICSISLAEMKSVLGSAVQTGRKTAVIVSHGFELLNQRRTRSNPIHVNRFEGLCRTLADRRDDMPTAWFSDLGPASLSQSDGNGTTLETGAFLTLQRIWLQLFGRVYG